MYPMQALTEQFPHENGYKICYDTFKFEAEELHIAVPFDSNETQCVIALEPTTAKARHYYNYNACSPAS